MMPGTEKFTISNECTCKKSTPRIRHGVIGRHSHQCKPRSPQSFAYSPALHPQRLTTEVRKWRCPPFRALKDPRAAPSVMHSFARRRRPSAPCRSSSSAPPPLRHSFPLHRLQALPQLPHPFFPIPIIIALLLPLLRLPSPPLHQLSIRAPPAPANLHDTSSISPTSSLPSAQPPSPSASPPV